MTDVITHKPLRVVTDGGVWPYISVPVAQLDELKQTLDSRGIRYWVEDNLFSMDGGPEIATINFGRNGDAYAVQAALDSAQ